MSDPEILEQIEQCKAAYFASKPASRTALREESTVVPTRVQPGRDRDKPRRFMFFLPHLREVDSLANRLICDRRRDIRGTVASRLAAELAFSDDLQASVSIVMSAVS